MKKEVNQVAGETYLNQRQRLRRPRQENFQEGDWIDQYNVHVVRILMPIRHMDTVADFTLLHAT